MEITLDTVRDIMISTLCYEPEQIQLDTNLFETLEMDSLEAVELSLALEDALGVGIADGDMENIKTVGDIVNYLQAHKA